MSQPTAFRKLFSFALCFALCFAALSSVMIGHDYAQQSLTPVPSGSTINVTVSAQSPSGAPLSYRWLATDGVVANANTPSTSPSTSWTLPKGQGLHFLYVLISDSQGGYTEKRIAIFTTDPNATFPAVVNGDPVPSIPPIPPSPIPLATVRGWLQDQRPSISMQLVDEFTGKQFGPVITDNDGQFAFHNLPQSTYEPYIADAPGQPFRVATELNGPFSVSDNLATSNYSDLGSTYTSDRLGNVVVSGHVTLANGSTCGDSSAFFGVGVNAVATLVDSTDKAVSLPVPVNGFGNYEIDSSLSTTGTYSVQVRCENAPLQLAPVSVVVDPILTNLYSGVNVTIPSTPPIVTGFAATLNGTPIQLSTAATSSLPSDSLPKASQFLSTKGLDSRTGACLYYVAVGAATGCDAAGAPIGGITFDAWKKQSGLAPYNATPEASATYVNEVDLNLTRNHHGIQTANGVAMYVCNYVGPADDTVQAQIDTAVANASTTTNQNLVACVAMDYVTAPTNPSVNGGTPFTRFLTFGPSGHLLLSVNLDGRGEKFLPGTCVACHGGENYAGSYPTDGTGAANIGAHFLPFDEGNFVFSSLAGFQLPDQAAQIKALNQLVLQTNATPSAVALINGWYLSGSSTEDNSYVPSVWVNPTDANIPNMYSGVIKHSCRTCHIAQTGQWDLDSQGLSEQNGICGGSEWLPRNHNMPNSKVTFDRMWLSQGSTTPGTDQVSYITAWLNDLNGGPTTCSYATRDPSTVYPVTSSSQSCNYTFSPSRLSLSGAAQTATVTITASGPVCSGYLYGQGFTVPGTTVSDPAPVVSPAPLTVFNPGTSGTSVTISVSANPDGAARFSPVSFLDSGYGQFDLGITQSAQLTGIAQNIIFGPLNNAAFGTPSVVLAAASSSGLPVSLTSTTTGVCTLVGSTVSLVAPGTCTITATQAGNSSYLPATPVVQSFQVTLGTPAITFDAIPNHILGVSPFAITAHSSNALPVSFASTTPAVCTTAGALVTLRGAGTCSVTARQGALSATRTFTVELARPSATFSPALGNLSATSNSAASGLVGDFNGDGVPDIASLDSGSGFVTVLLGNGLGGFTSAPGSPFTTGIPGYVSTGGNSSRVSIVAGDFNGDGIQDLASLSNVSSNGNLYVVSVLLGTGTGGFLTPAIATACAAGIPATSMAVADFNGDGTQDLAVACAASNNIAVLLGNGSGSFTPAAGSPFAVGPVSAFPTSLVVGDFNGDGIADLATANITSNDLTVLLGNGSGGFTSAPGSPFAIGGLITPGSMVVGDFNGDGFQDVALGNNTNITVLLGNGSGGFTPAPGSPIAVSTDSMVVGDFNGDGIQDLATTSYVLSGDVTVLYGNGLGGFAASTGIPFPLAAIPAYVVVADFNGDGIEDIAGPGYLYDPTIGQSVSNITVLLGLQNQTITFGAAPTVKVGTTGTVSATATSGLAVAFTSTTPTICTVSGTTVTGVAAGTCTIAGNQAGNTTYSAAPQVTQNITVGKGSQTITFGTAPAVMVSGTGTVSATATSSLAVTFTSTTTSICTVSGSTVTGVAAGTCTIAANQAGNTNYNAATQVTQSITVTTAKANQTITFGTAPSVKVAATGTVSATATSGLAVAFTSTTPTICTVSGTTVTGVAAGTCTIAGNQAGNTTYNAAPQVTQNITVGKGSQTITFGTAPAVTKGGTGTVSATATSSLAVTFTSTTTNICTVSGSTVTGVAAGTCTIAANQAGNTNYNAATQVTQSITVTTAKANQTITFGTAPTVKVGTSGTVSATATSSLAVAFTSTTPTICTVSGSTVTGVAAGTCTIAGNQAGNTTYNAAPQVTQNITVGKGSQTITLSVPTSITRPATGAAIATATSGLAVTLTSETSSVCTISGTTVTGIAAGTCTIAANQAGNANYNAAAQVTKNITVH
jgi:hypothetical protein